MMERTNRPLSRKQKNLEFYLDQALPSCLAEAFLRITEGETVSGFFEKILIPMSIKRQFGGELLKEAMESGGASAVDILMIACGFLTEAKAALARGDRQSAWSAALDATSYWARTMSANDYVMSLSNTVAEEVQHEVSRMAAKASAARHHPFKVVQAAAVRLVQKKGQAGERWDNATAAVKAILPELLSELERNDLPFSASDGGIKTLAGHLKKVPELASYFLEKRGRPPKNKNI